MKDFINEPLIELFISESYQTFEALEQIMILSEVDQSFSVEAINEIFRHMHSIKGSSAMMMYNNISELAHVIEDFFFLIRDDASIEYDFSTLVDAVLASVDFFKNEINKVQNETEPDGSNEKLVNAINSIVAGLDKKELEEAKSKTDIVPQKYYIRPNTNTDSLLYFDITVYFDEGCEMENIRAYTIVQNVTEMSEELNYSPADIIENERCIDVIRTSGFNVLLATSRTLEEVRTYFENVIFLSKLELTELDDESYLIKLSSFQNNLPQTEVKLPKASKNYESNEIIVPDTIQSSSNVMINVHVEKLDGLMDMVGELVIAEAMVTQNPDVKKYEIESFEKASRQLQKISNDMQDMVMSIRMVPLSTTFLKMHRIVRDMTRKLEKDVALEVYGEETEVDKSIIEKIGDPLMHIIRNSLDHGIESQDERLLNEKPSRGLITLEAKNSGSEVLIIVKDDGKGLDTKQIYDKASRQGIVHKSFEDMSNKEIYNLILKPGFSTNEVVTEYSGRGVGMDVVSKNIEDVGGTVLVDSEKGVGTSITLKIPLTLAIIDGMNLKVGESRFTLPLLVIKESFKAESESIFEDTNKNEMIMVRGECIPVLRLHKYYDLETEVTETSEGILVMVEENENSCCLFVDELLGQQQVVVKTLPNYIKMHKNITGLGGCTLLGDGRISLILDIGDLNESRAL